MKKIEDVLFSFTVIALSVYSFFFLIFLFVDSLFGYGLLLDYYMKVDKENGFFIFFALTVGYAMAFSIVQSEDMSECIDRIVSVPYAVIAGILISFGALYLTISNYVTNI